jgi:Asp-tRNA(Asn)/Glu-tRNA(Gln) amidotransferase A subunit family amidase
MISMSKISGCLVSITAGMLISAGAWAQFRIEETSIAAVQDALASGTVSSVELVQASLARIAAYDKTGPSINAIITVNPRALERARELDELYARGDIQGPLHGIPIIVKDNYDTADMATSAGSLSLKNSLPPDDAWQVRQLRAAGAIIIAKANMYEFAFSPYETVGSALPGHTLNPYALNRVPAGSSGGTAAAVAASFAVAGLGTDTGNSIRGPAAHNALVGIRSTLGLTSRDGIVPLYLDHDVGGPMTRSVADAAILLDVIAGFDPADAITEGAKAVAGVRYANHLDAGGLRGARIGVLRQLSNRDGADAEVLQKFAAALRDLQNGGAEIVDPVEIAELERLVPPIAGEPLKVWCNRFKADLEDYLRSLGESAPVKSLQEIIDSGRYHPQLEADLEFFARQAPPEVNDECRESIIGREQLRVAVRATLKRHSLDALVYPTWSNPPRLIGDRNTAHGDNSQHIAPHTGFPAITVPMGYVQGALPVGLQLVGDAYTEATLIKLAYAYEQATQHRRPPASTPPLR